MKLRIYQIDAFTDQVFRGNPAAVCILDEWLEESLMQKIAAENNLAETAFVVKKDNSFQIRWFTPKVEVNLCGHATLASAFVLYNYYGVTLEKIDFNSPRSGLLSVSKSENELTLDFPTDDLEAVAIPGECIEAFGLRPNEAYKGKTDYMLIFDSEKDVVDMKPNLAVVAGMECRGVIVSAPGEDVDFVSRFFAPQSGIDEDPVTGSAHTSLTPYWSRRLNKTTMKARQVSERQGELTCSYLGERVKIMGSAVVYMVGEIDV
ncbi:MAG: PhzF family phenazine biosynthesis protein [Cyclobacteriaceae bacterium]